MHSFLLFIAVLARLQYDIQFWGESHDSCSKSEEPRTFCCDDLFYQLRIYCAWR